MVSYAPAMICCSKRGSINKKKYIHFSEIIGVTGYEICHVHPD